MPLGNFYNRMCGESNITVNSIAGIPALALC